MKQPVSKERSESRVAAKFRKLYVPLIELLAAIDDLEPPGTAISEPTVTVKPESGISVAYHAHSTSVTVVDGKRRFTLKIDTVSK